MAETNMLEELARLLKMKKSKAFYATKLGITTQEVDDLLKEYSFNYFKKSTV